MNYRLARIASAAVCGVVFSVLPYVAHADGLFVPPPDYWINETEQEAVVFFTDNHEDMIVSSSFKGDAEQFAWIIPTPSQPTVERGSWELFAGLRDITEAPVTDLRLGGMEGEFDASSYIAEDAVKEISRQSIAYYDVAVLEARTTDGLMQWFSDNGFSYPADQTYILDDYIKAGWYFTAVKLNTDTLSTPTQQAVMTGKSIPLHLSFATDRMVFPLQLSQVSAEYTNTANKRYNAVDSVGITLYIIADHKQSLPQFTQNYAGYISAKAVSELSFDTDGKPLLLKNYADDTDKDARYVLTKVYRYFPVSEMTYDLYPRQEENAGILNEEGAASSAMRNMWIFGGVSLAAIIVLVGVIGKMNTQLK